MTRIEDLCHIHVSHKWLYQLDACAGSVRTPHDYITNVQRSLGNRSCAGFGGVDHLWTLNLSTVKHACTAEPTCGHHACVHAVLGGLRLADPGITTEPRGLSETQSRPADIFTTAAVPGRSAVLDACVASSNAAAAR